MKVIKFKIENYCRVEALSGTPNGNHIVITGRNASGKSSAVNAFFEALKTRGDRSPAEKAIRDGADKALITIDIGSYVIERHITESGPRLVIRDHENKPLRNPSEILDGLVGALALDPTRFDQMRPVDQLDAILEVAHIAHPIDQVREITGDNSIAPKPDQTPFAWLTWLSADEEGHFYLKRRSAHQDLEQKKGALAEAEMNLAKLNAQANPSGDGAKVRSQSQLSAALAELNQRDTKRRELQAEADAAKAFYKEQAAKLDGLKSDRGKHMAAKAASEKRQEEIAAEISRLRLEQQQGQELLDQVNKDIAALDERITKGDGVVGELQVAASAKQHAVDMCPNTDGERHSIHEELKSIEGRQELAIKARVAEQEAVRIRAEVEACKERHEALDDILKELRALRRNLVVNSGIDLGVDNIALTEEGILVNNAPFAQASRAERYRIACSVAMHQNPAVRLIPVDDAEHLDRASRAILYGLAAEMDFQLLMTEVKSDQNLTIEIIEANSGAEAAAV